MSIETDLPTHAVAVDAPAGPGRALFDRRRWIIPPFVLTAFCLGGASTAARVTGGLLLLAALTLHMAACTHIGGASRVHSRKAARRRVLVTGGPFARTRNPIYAGNALGAAGICLVMGPAWFAALALLGVLLLYDRIVAWEETLLSGLYGETYARYRTAVPRWLPFGRAPAGQDGAAPERWPIGKVLRRERGTLVLAGIAILLAMLRPLLGPPLV